MIAGERLHVRGFPRLNLRTKFLLVDRCVHMSARAKAMPRTTKAQVKHSLLAQVAP